MSQQEAVRRMASIFWRLSVEASDPGVLSKRAGEVIPFGEIEELLPHILEFSKGGQPSLKECHQASTAAICAADESHSDALVTIYLEPVITPEIGVGYKSSVSVHTTVPPEEILAILAFALAKNMGHPKPFSITLLTAAILEARSHL